MADEGEQHAGETTAGWLLGPFALLRSAARYPHSIIAAMFKTCKTSVKGVANRLCVRAAVRRAATMMLKAFVAFYMVMPIMAAVCMHLLCKKASHKLQPIVALMHRLVAPARALRNIMAWSLGVILRSGRSIVALTVNVVDLAADGALHCCLVQLQLCCGRLVKQCTSHSACLAEKPAHGIEAMGCSCSRKLQFMLCDRPAFVRRQLNRHRLRALQATPINSHTASSPALVWSSASYPSSSGHCARSSLSSQCQSARCFAAPAMLATCLPSWPHARPTGIPALHIAHRSR